MRKVTTEFLHHYPRCPLPENDLQVLVEYSRRVDEFIENYEDLTRDQDIISYGIHRSRDGKTETFETPGFNRHRVKGLLLDYRALSSEKEESSFNRVRGRIGKFYLTRSWNVASKYLSDNWKITNPTTSWDGHSFDEICRVIFNNRLFHGDVKLRSEYLNLSDVFCEETIGATLFLGIKERISPIVRLQWVVSDIEKQNNPIRLPIEQPHA